MTLIHYLGPDGDPVPVSTSNPVPTAGGGGMSADDITATAPVTWDAETATVGVDTGTTAGTVSPGDHTHTPASIGAATSAQGDLADSAVQPSDLAGVATSGAYADLSGVPVAANVDPGSATFAEDLVGALVAAGLMASA